MAKDFAKSKCFIKTDNGYEEITYEELLRREEADPSYKGRRFLPLHGMLMEVTPEQYRDFYKERRRQKYLYERSKENRDISIDMLTTEQFNGADILFSDEIDIEEQVAHKLLLDKLHSCLSLLTEEERELIYALFFGEKTERARESLALLDESEAEIRKTLENMFYPYYIHARLQPRRLREYKQHLSGLLDEVEARA